MCYYVNSLSSIYFFILELKPNTSQIQQEGCLFLSISCLTGNLGEMRDSFSWTDKGI